MIGNLVAHPESEFTAPSLWCGNPELWSAPDGDSAECEVSALVGAFVRALKPWFVLETGSAFGATSIAIGEALRANGRGHLHSLERDGSRAEIAFNLVAQAGLGDQITIFNADSLTWTPPRHARYEFAWFDSALGIRDLEFERFLPQIEPNALVGFHDTGPLHGVEPKVRELVRRGLLTPLFLPTPRGVAFAQVNS